MTDYDAIAWAESAGRHAAEKLEARVAQLEKVVQVFEQRLNALALHELANEPDDVREVVLLVRAAREAHEHLRVAPGVNRGAPGCEDVFDLLSAALEPFEGR